MATSLDPDIRRYQRVGAQRQQDGRLVLDKLQRPRAAVYLAGYAAECAMKALLLSLTPATTRRDLLASFRGARAHDLGWLRRQIVATGKAIPLDIERDISFLSTWSVDLRYEPGAGDYEEAEEFMEAVRRVVDWIERSI